MTENVLNKGVTMRQNGHFNTVGRRVEIAFGIIAATGTLALVGSGCGDTPGETSSAPKQPEATRTTTTTDSNSGSGEVAITFDDLGGGSSVIRVFPGVENSVADLKKNGTFFSGQKWDAICDTEGRLVESDPSVGEINRSSDKWFKLAPFPRNHDEHFATAVYIEEPQQALDELPPC